jgi:Flp pilus assembly pilin Flp
MLLKYVAKLFALEPKANAIEAGIIVALVFTALVATLFAVRDPLAGIYSSFLGDLVVGVR